MTTTRDLQSQIVSMIRHAAKQQLDDSTFADETLLFLYSQNRSASSQEFQVFWTIQDMIDMLEERAQPATATATATAT